MKPFISFLILTAVASVFCALTFSSEPVTVDLEKAIKNGKVGVFNREFTTFKEGNRFVLRLAKEEGEGVAWLKDVDFSNGVLEFEVRGEDLKQHSFVGIAFHGKDNSTFDAIYFRPFQFKETDEVLRSRSIQYISLPDFTWRKLREISPGKFEHAIDPSPDPNSWMKVRIVIDHSTVSTFVNGSSTPNLVVEKVTKLDHGMIGFYVADTSGGDFANITITPAN